MMHTEDENALMATMKILQQDIHNTCVNKGFWDGHVNVATKLMLIVSEAAEAMEDDRNATVGICGLVEYAKNDQGHLRIVEELADVVIRCMDLAEYLNGNLALAILDKHKANKERPHKHGGKRY